MKIRQKILLAILSDLPIEPEKTLLVKLLFLLSQQTEISKQVAFYDFLPYRFGPFSFTIYQDLADLQRYGLLRADSLEIIHGQRQRVKEIANSLPKDTQQNIDTVLKRYGHLSPNRIVSHVYELYPWYASRSERKPHLSRNIVPPAVYTTGYEGKSIDAFLDALLRKGIQRIIDVRNNPISRKYGFSKTALQNIANKVEIDYVHIPELGIPSKDRKSLETLEDYELLFEMYERQILPQERTAIKKTASLLFEKPSALMCFERDVESCHRGRLAKHLATMTHLPSIHL